MLTSGSNDGKYGLNLMILLSLLFHALIMSALFFSSPRSSPRWTFGPVYSVQLVSPSEISSGASGTKSDLPPGETKATLSKDLTTVTKSLPGRMAPLSLEKNTLRKEQKDEVEKAVENIREKVQAAKPAAPAVTKGSRGTPVAPTGIPSGANEGKVRINAYYAVIWSMIKAQWALPGAMVPPGNIETIIHVRVLRSGAVTELSFEKRSGNRYLDESAMKAIQKASPFPPLPEGGGIGDGIELGIRFHSSELR